MPKPRIIRPEYLAPDFPVDHLIIGAGVVGLAIARQLVKITGRSTFVVERHESAGQETSSRNSEVIHSGIHYSPESLKTKLCILGRQLLYDYAKDKNIPFRKTQKLTVATTEEQLKYLKKLAAHCESIPSPGPVSGKLISAKETLELEPNLNDAVTGAYLSPETGIIDVHGYTDALEQDITNSEQGDLVYGTKVVRIDRLDAKSGKGKRGDGTDEGWVVQTQTEGQPNNAILAKILINAAGLSAPHFLNQVADKDQQREAFYCKGSYFAYKGPGVSHVKHLLYPCPEPRFAGLGTHLTLNMAGAIRFGPDIEWLTPPPDYDPDFWNKLLEPNEARLDQFVEAVKGYLPGVDKSGFSPDYCGIRPKLVNQGSPASDFVVDMPAPGLINLMGIESPGLTSSLAIGDYVSEQVRKAVWGLGKGNGKSISGSGKLDDWS